MCPTMFRLWRNPYLFISQLHRAREAFWMVLFEYVDLLRFLLLSTWRAVWVVGSVELSFLPLRRKRGDPASLGHPTSQEYLDKKSIIWIKKQNLKSKGLQLPQIVSPPKWNLKIIHVECYAHLSSWFTLASPQGRLPGTQLLHYQSLYGGFAPQSWAKLVLSPNFGQGKAIMNAPNAKLWGTRHCHKHCWRSMFPGFHRDLGPSKWDAADQCRYPLFVP